VDRELLGSQRVRLLSLLVASFALGCGVGQVTQDGEGDSAIIGGVATSGYPEVGILGVTGPAEMCTGFLVASDLVLTAAHCIVGGTAYGFYTGVGSQTTVRVVTEQTLDALPNLTKHAVRESVMYPGVNFAVSPYAFDVAYVRLAAPLADVTPAALGSTPALYEPCTAVGYGMVQPTFPTGLRKKSAVEWVRFITADDIGVAAATGAPTHGDSGGPLLCGGEAVGVFSWVGSVSTGPAPRYARIDGAVGAWLEGVLGAPLR
jgi:hypothetical protein